MLCDAGEQVAGPAVLAYCFAQVALDLTVFVHQRNLQPGIRNVDRLLERTLILLSRAGGEG
jgi:heme/copper-type cytochrome/quinol oxidase subunit 4